MMRLKYRLALILLVVPAAGCKLRDWLGNESTKRTSEPNTGPKRWHWDDNQARELQKQMHEAEVRRMQDEYKKAEKTQFDWK